MQSKTGGYYENKIGRKISRYIQGLRDEAPGTIGGIIIKIEDGKVTIID